MTTLTMQARLMALVLAVVASAVVLGSTVAGMQSNTAAQPVVVLEHVTVRPTTLQ